MKRAGRPCVLKPHQLRQLVAKVKEGTPSDALQAHFGVSERTLRRHRARHGLVARRLTVLTLLDQARGGPRLDLARRVLDLEEWLRLPRLERTIEALERIRGVPFHRQHARWFREAKAIGISLRRVEPVDGPAYYEAEDPGKARRVLSPVAIEAATKARLEFERRRGHG